MIGVDTNVLVRLVVADAPEQATAARVLLEEAEARGQKVFINRLVLAELLWVLASQYRTSKAEALATVEMLIHHPMLQMEDKNAVQMAATTAKGSRQSLADLLVAATNAARGCETTFTFDRIAARSPHFTLLS